MVKTKQQLKFVPPSIYSTPDLPFLELEIELFRRQLEKLRRPFPHENEQKIIDYLNSGCFFAMVFGAMNDPITDEFMGYPNLFTDGVWIWENSLPNYVKKYHLILPEEFLGHMKNNNWIAKNDLLFEYDLFDYDNPELSDEDIESLDFPDISYEVTDYDMCDNCKRIVFDDDFDKTITLTREEYKEYLMIKREWFRNNDGWRIIE